jgi:hypothetical protein
VKTSAGRKQVVVLETQLDFWIATGLPAIPKDERPTMEHLIYAVEDGDTRQITYEHNGNKIEITPSVAGRATQHDKDIVLFCVSKLVAAINAGIAVSPTIETTAHELLSFTRSSTSERGYELLSKAFDRLTGTRMRATFESTKDRDGSRRWVGLLDDVEIITRGAKNRMCAIRIKVSDTTFNAAKAMDVLTIPATILGCAAPSPNASMSFAGNIAATRANGRSAWPSCKRRSEAPSPKRSFAPGSRSWPRPAACSTTS